MPVHHRLIFGHQETTPPSILGCAVRSLFGVWAALKLLEKNHWALFVGQWPPTLLLFGIYHRLVKPGR